jgi:hypothetical protein
MASPKYPSSTWDVAAALQTRFYPLRGLFSLLDSGLRRNDEPDRLSGIKTA